jgi:hypothetical protein
MGISKDRILKPNNIPDSLWSEKESTLFIPPILADAYVQLIDSHGLRKLGCNRPKGPGPVGGLTQEECDTHFAQAFDGSSARALLALLDPKSEAGSTSDMFLRCLAGGNICFTDAPCGAGAAAFTFLAAIAQLRAENVLPRTPLHIQLIGAEISTFARGHAENVLKIIHEKLADQAIFVEPEFLPWDVTDSLSNTDLVKVAVTKSNNKNHKLLVIANFNGFLEGNGKRKDAEPQLQELFRYASGVNSFAIWIEPIMNPVTVSGGLFSRLRELFAGIKVWKQIGSPEVGTDKPTFTSVAKFRLVLQPDQTRPVRLAVMPITLDRNK